MILDSAKNVRWIIPFKKFGMVRINSERVSLTKLLYIEKKHFGTDTKEGSTLTCR